MRHSDSNITTNIHVADLTHNVGLSRGDHHDGSSCLPGETKATFVKGLPCVNLVDLGWEAHARGTLLRVRKCDLVTS